MITAWNIRRKNATTVLCCIVYYNSAQWYAHMYEQFLLLIIAIGLCLLFCVFSYHFVLLFAFVVLGLVLTYLLSCTVSEIQPLMGIKSLCLATDLCKIFHGCQWMAKVSNGIEKLPKISTDWVGCTNVTDDRQTGDSMFAKNGSKISQLCSALQLLRTEEHGYNWQSLFSASTLKCLNSQTCKQVHQWRADASRRMVSCDPWTKVHEIREISVNWPDP